MASHLALPSTARTRPCPPSPSHRVTQVLDGQLEVQTKDGTTELIPFSTCVWAAGIAMHPLVSSVRAEHQQIRMADLSARSADLSTLLTGSHCPGMQVANLKEKLPADLQPSRRWGR